MPQSWRARTRCSGEAPQASSGTHSKRPGRACGPHRGCTPCGVLRRERKQPSRAVRGCHRPSCWTPRPSRSRPRRWRRRSNARRTNRRDRHGSTWWGLRDQHFLAVQAGGQDLRHRGLAGAARAHEQVGVMDIAPFHRMAQGTHDGLLADHVGKRAGAMLAIERLWGHLNASLPLRAARSDSVRRVRSASSRHSGLGPRARLRIKKRVLPARISHAIRQYPTRWGPATFAISVGAHSAVADRRSGLLNYDTLYALVWGQQITRGETPEYGLPIAPTPHPLAELLGIPLAPLGASAESTIVVALGVPGLVGMRMGALQARRGLVRACRRRGRRARVPDQGAGALIWS